MDKKNCIVIAAGGTGGHVFPSIGLAYYLMKDYDIEIFTDERGIKYLNNHKNIKVKKITSSRVFGKNIIYFIIGIIRVFLSIIFSIILLIKLKPKLIIGMGGYSSFPVCLSGFFLKIPIFIYENNLVIGRANKILLPFSKKILVSTNSVQGIDSKYKNKISHIGFLLRDNILGVKNTNLEVTKNNLSILVIGGSQSAKVFGEQIPEVIEECNKKGIKFNVYQQCLESQKNNIQNIYGKLNIKFELFSFCDDLSKYYQKSDIAITRCGASSMAELVNLRIPFVAVPLPSSIDNHQLKNAKYFNEKNYCFLLEQKFLLFKLLNILQDAHQDRNKLYSFKQKMSKHSDKESLMKAKQIIKDYFNGKI